jgi:YgiT-type zinc finger domain-containing protein
MICVVCHNGQTRLGTTTIAFHRQGRTVVVTEVPAEVCENCQEPYVGEEASARVLEIAGEARQARAQVLVRDFTTTTAA